MDVIFDCSLFAHNKRKKKGKPERVNLSFEHGGIKHYVPIVFRFFHGIVFDIISIQDVDTVRQFEAKHGSSDEYVIEDTSLIVELDCSILIDGIPPKKGYSSSSSVFIPWHPEEGENLAIFLEAYPDILPDDVCFSVTRFKVELPHKLATSFTSLTLEIPHSERLMQIDKCFTLDCNSEWQSEAFINPVDGNEYILAVRAAEEIDISKNLPKLASRVMNIPPFVRRLEYYTLPDIAASGRLCIVDALKDAKIEIGGDSRGPHASAIGIIGGSDGPTVIFMTDKSSEAPSKHPLTTLFTKPQWERKTAVDLCIDGIYVEKHPAQTVRFTLPD